MIEYDKLRELIDGCDDDVAKASQGNKSAGTRIRKAMQGIKTQAQEIRAAILKLRDD